MRLFILIFALLTIAGFSNAGEVKVLTYNIYRKPEPFGFGGRTHAKKRVKQLCLELKKTDYDVIMLQEAWLSNDRKYLSNCGYPFVMDITNVDYYRPGRAAANGREQNLETGLLILSKYPFIKNYRVSYGERGNWWTLFSDGEIVVSKAVYAAQIVFPGDKKIWFFNTHLAANYCDYYPWVNCEPYEDVRAEQVKMIAKLISNTDGPIVLGGDLNMGDKLSSRDRIWDQWQDYFPGFSQAPHDPKRSSTSSSTNMFKETDNGKIDHLFGSADLIKTKGNVVFDQLMNIEGLSLHLSDHYGWETTFSF